MSGVCFSDYCVLVVYLDDVTVSGFDLFGLVVVLLVAVYWWEELCKIFCGVEVFCDWF